MEVLLPILISSKLSFPFLSMSLQIGPQLVGSTVHCPVYVPVTHFWTCIL